MATQQKRDCIAGGGTYSNTSQIENSMQRVGEYQRQHYRVIRFFLLCEMNETCVNVLEIIYIGYM